MKVYAGGLNVPCSSTGVGWQKVAGSGLTAGDIPIRSLIRGGATIGFSLGIT